MSSSVGASREPAGASKHPPAHDDLEEIELSLLLEGVFRQYGFDFREYAPASLRRRVWRRVFAEGLQTISALQDKLLHDPACMERLLLDLSVNVTAMFRDPSFYVAFREKVVPLLRTYPFVRIWHAGCSTGEEVYSLAILLEEENINQRTRIYATDLSEEAVRQARMASIRASALDKLAENYLKAGGKRSLSDYFKKKGNRLLIDPALKKNIVLSEHNLATDGSFNEFQVIVCRDVIGNFNYKLRERVGRLIYDSLSQFGFLALGGKESLGELPYEDRYALLDGE